MKTLVVGHVTHDHVEGGFVAGGCAFYGAKVHQQLKGDFSATSFRAGESCEVHLASAVGEDFVCHEAIEDLSTTVTRRGETTVFTNLYPAGEPRVQLVEAQGVEIEPADIPKEWLNADLIHLAPVMGEVDLVKWKNAVGGGVLAINIQGWIKVAGPLMDTKSRQVVQRLWEVSDEELYGVDIACVSEEDLIGQGELLERLVRAVPIVALTLGALGSRIYINGVEAAQIGIYPTEVVDPTGAGDVFAATFSQKIVGGHEPLEAARMASAAASIIIEDIGPRAMNRLNEIEDRLGFVESHRG